MVTMVATIPIMRHCAACSDFAHAAATVHANELGVHGASSQDESVTVKVSSCVERQHLVLHGASHAPDDTARPPTAKAAEGGKTRVVGRRSARVLLHRRAHWRLLHHHALLHRLLRLLLLHHHGLRGLIVHALRLSHHRLLLLDRLGLQDHRLLVIVRHDERRSGGGGGPFGDLAAEAPDLHASHPHLGEVGVLDAVASPTGGVRVGAGCGTGHGGSSGEQGGAGAG